MTSYDEPKYRNYYQPDPDSVELREHDGEEGMFSVRMPIATTGEVRNEGDDPLSNDEVSGMGQQIEGRAIGVFLDHGSNPDMAGSRYSAIEKVGEWADPETATRDADDETELVATARMMDPETLPDSTGRIREGLAALKEQAKRGLSLSSSIGWRDDESAPGGVDLMEVSIVGIPADPRTTSQDAAVSMARAVAADANLDDATAEQLVADFRAVVMGSDPDDTRHLSDQQAEMAVQALDTYRSEQGNGSVSNFEEWMYTAGWNTFDDEQSHAAMTALREFYRSTTPLEEPVNEQFVPFLDEQAGGDTETNDMTDTDTSTEQSGDTDRDSDGTDDADYRESMLEMQQQQTDLLRTLVDDRADDDDDDEEDEDDEEEDEEDDGGEQSADAEGTDADADDEERSLEDEIAELREELAEARASGEIDTPDDPDEERDADRDAEETTTEGRSDGPDWRA